MKKSVKSLQDGFIKFHGCGVYRRDGSNVLCTKTRPCFKPVNACFWMLGKDVKKKVRTRNRELNERIYHSQSLKKQYHIKTIKNDINTIQQMMKQNQLIQVQIIIQIMIQTIANL